MSKQGRKEPFAPNTSRINNSILPNSFMKKSQKSLVTVEGDEFIQLSQP